MAFSLGYRKWTTYRLTGLKNFYIEEETMRTVKILTLVLSFFVLSSNLLAETEKNESKTKLEEFSGETGVVIIKGFQDVGKIGGVTVTSRVFTNANTGKKEYGITINVAGYRERDDTSFIDYDEIQSLIKGSDYISKIEKSVTKLSHYEATYQTKGGFSITKFNSSDGKTSLAVSSGNIGPVTAFLPMAKLSELKQMIINAKMKIDSIK